MGTTDKMAISPIVSMPDARVPAPIMPAIADVANAPQFIAKGLASMVAQRQYAQQLELANQKMVQDAALKDEGFKFAREKLAQELPLQNAQIANYNAEASLRNAQATKASKDQSDAIGAANGFIQGLATIPETEIGTPAGDLKLKALDAQAAGLGAFTTKEGLTARSGAFLRQRLKETQIAGAVTNLDKSLNQQMYIQKGVPVDRLDQLDMKPDGSFKPNNVWGKASDNSGFITFQTGKDANGQPVKTIVPPDTIANTPNAKTPEQQKALGFSFVTFTPSELKLLKSNRDKSNLYHNSLTVGPTVDGVNNVVQGQQAAQTNQAQPADASIQMLRQDPGLADAFDQRYGVGAASKVLGY